MSSVMLHAPRRDAIREDVVCDDLVTRERSSVESHGARCPSDRMLHPVVTNASKRTILRSSTLFWPGQICL